MKCKIESCNNHAEKRALEPSDEQKWLLNADWNYYYICDKCEDKGWKYNTVSDEYYFRPAHRVKVILNLKESKMDNKDDSVPCFDSKGNESEFENDMKKLEEDGVLEIVEMPPRDFEYDEYGRKFSRIKRSFGCKKCSDNCYNACKTLRDAGYKIEIKRTKTTMIEFKRVRDVTVEEHGINKPYKGVYACVVCGHEEIMDNSLEES